jgi:hypothetical protein
MIRYSIFTVIRTSSLQSSHTLSTPLILHTNRHRRLRELLLRLSLAVCLVLLAHCLATDVL